MTDGSKRLEHRMLDQHQEREAVQKTEPVQLGVENFA
jgi:hypothetical protein